MYKVKKEDLIGFPIEVVQRMIECQVEDDGVADISVFQKRASEGFTLRSLHPTHHVVWVGSSLRIIQ